MAYPTYPRHVTRTHRKNIINIIREDSIIHGREVGLFELMTALETPDVQKEIVRGQATEWTIKQAMPKLIPLRQIRWRMQKLQQEQEKRDKERMILYELRDILREGQERLDLHYYGGTPDETFERIKSEPLDSWAINPMFEHGTPLLQYDIDGVITTTCGCGLCLWACNHYGFRTILD